MGSAHTGLSFFLGEQILINRKLTPRRDKMKMKVTSFRSKLRDTNLGTDYLYVKFFLIIITEKLAVLGHCVNMVMVFTPFLQGC